MKKLIFITFVLFISLAFTNSYAEVLKAKIIDSGKVVLLYPDGTWKYDTITKEIRSDFDIPEKRKFNHPPFSESYGSAFRLQQKYDKFKNKTIVSLSLDLKPSKIRYSSNKLAFNSFFFYLGEKVKTPSFVMIAFQSTTDDWEYLRSHELTFLIDDKPLEIGTLKHKGSVGKGYVIEFLSKLIPLSHFLMIVNSKKVDGKLFTTEFRFTEEQLEALRDYASRMK